MGVFYARWPDLWLDWITLLLWKVTCKCVHGRAAGPGTDAGKAVDLPYLLHQAEQDWICVFLTQTWAFLQGRTKFSLSSHTLPSHILSWTLWLSGMSWVTYFLRGPPDDSLWRIDSPGTREEVKRLQPNHSCSSGWSLTHWTELGLGIKLAPPQREDGSLSHCATVGIPSTLISLSWWYRGQLFYSIPHAITTLLKPNGWA